MVRENIQAIDIGGRLNFYIVTLKKPNNQFRAVDEEGTSIADFFADTAGEVLPTAGAVVGAYRWFFP